jgi:spore coat polysaccharide biosynthesis predicted glycosyltransferase SpsG/RimJ/RimL family protein N-acetyltransferase
VSLIAFRCDGGERVGAGHVARSLQIARAFEAGGDEALFVGEHDGVALALLEAAGMPRAAAVPAGADALVVDSYEVSEAELERAAAERPVVLIGDAEPARAAPTLTYHLDAAPEVAIGGPDYVPVDPRLLAARRERGFERLLVTLGGGGAAPGLRERALDAAGELEVAEGGGVAGLLDLIGWADVAISAAGLTPYELACAGVPAAIVAVADNQLRVARTFGDAGLALVDELPAAMARLADPAVREKLAARGPAVVDGYGAYRARDALRARFAGAPPPRVLRYRPATSADEDRLLEWRNDPDTRAASRSADPVDRPDHAGWLAAALADPRRVLLIVEAEGGPAGTLRFDLDGDAAEISVTVAPERRGAGIAAQAVREGSELVLAAWPRLARIDAVIRPGNRASITAFERAGFRQRGPADAALLAFERQRGL